MKTSTLIVILFAVIWSSTTSAQSFSQTEEERIKALALEAILEQPEVLRQAIEILQRRDEEAQLAVAQETLTRRRDELERDPNAPVIGNPDGDVTIVEFFDYNCPYCKRAAEAIDPLLESDKGVRLIYHEWPILGEASVFAARAALAARLQGKYAEMHVALMRQRRVTEQSTLQAAADIGLDVERLQIDMSAPEIDRHIELSMSLARDLGFSGMPSFVIGEHLVPGLVPLQRLEELVALVRAE
ncbi:MAG: DsbA family protein [Pseudomonadota bacterium]